MCESKEEEYSGSPPSHPLPACPALTPAPPILLLGWVRFGAKLLSAIVMTPPNHVQTWVCFS